MRMHAVLLVFLAGCQITPDSSDLVRKIQEVEDRMHARFAATRRIELAIALGDLPRAQDEARSIAKLDEPDVLPEWKPYFENVRAAARQIEASRSTVAAANGMALLGRRCAQCHAALEAKIVFPKDPAPAPGVKLATTMAGHQWAATRMWEGLIAPNQARWVEGARVLADAPLTIAAEGDVPPELAISNDVAKIRLFANRAIVAKTPDERANIYGELLGTCARCHHKIRDR